MAIDKGGLRYIISVQDQFTAPLKKFRGELAAIRAQMAGIRDAQKGITQQAQQTRQANREQEKFDIQRARRLQAQIKQQEQNEALRAKIFRANRKRLSDEAHQEINEFRRVMDAKAKVQGKATKEEQRQVGRTRELFQRLNRQVRLTDSSVNRISFTFRRLIGIFAVFQGLRVGAQAFVGLIRGGVQFNEALENAEIGMGGLISATGQLTDIVSGRLLQGAEGFGAAMEESKRQINLLQKDAVATSATFQELLSAFSGSVGAGLEAGLNLDQIRQITVLTSQAGAAMQLDARRLLNETRSLFRGNISPQNSLIATTLGLTAKDIKEAKSAGADANALYDLLISKLEAFGHAANATQQSFSGLMSRISDSLGLATGAASVRLFDQLKISMQEVIDSFVTLEDKADGGFDVLPNRASLGILTTLFDGIARAVQRLREGLNQILSEDFGNFVAGIASSFEFLAAVASGFLQGTLASFGGVFAGINAFVQQLTGGEGSDGVLALVEAIFNFLGRWVAPILTAAAAMAALKITLFVAGPLISIMAGSMTVVSVAARATATAMLFTIRRLKVAAAISGVWAGVTKTVAAGSALIGARWSAVVRVLLRAVAVAASLALIFKEVFSSVLGFDLTFNETLDIIILSVKKFLTQTGSLFAFQFKKIVNGIAGVFDGLWRLLKSGFFIILEGIASALREVASVADFWGLDVSDFEKSIGRMQKSINDFKRENEADDFTIFSPTEMVQGLIAANKEVAKFQEQIQAIADKAAARDAAKVLPDPADVEGDANSILASVGQLFDGLGVVIGGAFEDITGLDLDKLAEDFAAGLIDADALAKQIEDAIQKTDVSAPPKTERSDTGKFLDGVIENFDLTLTLARAMVEQFSAFVADSIVDAFDPTTDTSILERFAQFLKTLARMIIQELTKVAVAKLLLSAGIGGATGLAEGGSVPDAPGFAEGGQIPGGRAAPKIARPKGLDSRDTTPIWAQPGEFMVRKSVASNPEVNQFLDALNRGLIRPGALKGLLGSRSRRHIAGLSSRGPQGYAEGGRIKGAEAAATAVAAKPSGGNGPAPAFLVANDQTMEKMLAGGGQAFRRYLKDNAAEFDSILSRGRPGAT